MTKRMKRTVWSTVICAGLAGSSHAVAQAAVYGEFSASRLSGGPEGNYLYGGTAGLVTKVAAFGPHVRLLADVQGRFVQKSGEKVTGLTLGPRLDFPIARLHGFTPYAEFLAGFARYGDATHNGPTDAIFETDAGVTKQLSKRWDIVVDYSWAYYGAFLNEYDPQTFSVGAMFYFTRE